jgi:hypothetical protein
VPWAAATAATLSTSVAAVRHIVERTVIVSPESEVSKRYGG